MKNHHVIVTIVLIGGAALVYGIITLTIANDAQQKQEPVVEQVATTTEANTVATTTEPTLEPKKEVQTVYQPVYVPTQAPTPTVEITNGVKSEGGGTVNYYQAPQQQTPPATTAPAPDFIEPAPMTPLEIAQDIVEIYDPNGTAQLYGDNMIRVYVYGGKSVTTELTQGWEEKLKLTLNKIKK